MVLDSYETQCVTKSPTLVARTRFVDLLLMRSGLRESQKIFEALSNRSLERVCLRGPRYRCSRHAGYFLRKTTSVDRALQMWTAVTRTDIIVKNWRNFS